MKVRSAAFASFLLAGILWAQKPHSVVVTDVRFSGLNDVPLNVQADLVSRFKDKTFNNEAWVNELEEQTMMACQESGYFKANVEAKLEPLYQDLSHQQVAVNVSVEEGPLFRLKDIQVTGTTAFPAEQIRALFSIQPGEVFNTAKIHRGLYAALELYVEKGYIDFTPVPDTKIDDDTKRIELVIDVDEGPQYRVARLLVVGPNSHVNQRLMHDWESEINQSYASWNDFVQNHQSLLSSYPNLSDRTKIERDRQNHTVNLTLDLNP
jgi:outer membrane protein assembly factor BamA